LSGPARHPRLRPDGAWVVCHVWRGSWDVWAVHRASSRALAVTHDAAGELEPAWDVDGGGIVFGSDRRRGLGSTALYRVPFAPDVSAGAAE
jgi:Tol biopolymer transport system component